MKDRVYFNSLAVALIIALVMSLSVTINAFADDATPPPVQSDESALPPVDALPTDVPVETQNDESTLPPADAPVEVLPVEDPQLIPAEETPTDTPPGLLEQIPENTTVVVATDAGIEPLATQEAANSFVIGDPIWCPENATPVPGSNGCTGSYTTLAKLIFDIENSVIPQPNNNGVIWIMAGNDLSTSAISIDGSIFNTWRDYRLTLQGGWDGSGLSTTTGGSVFDKPIEIVNWKNNVTINDIIINGTNSNGLSVNTSGNVTVNDLSSNGNNGVGAELISTSGNVTLTGINQFNDNKDTGLYVKTTGVVDAQNVTAGNNGVGVSYGAGAEVYASKLTLSGANVFNGNKESGLFADVDGDITITNITANGNGMGNHYGAGAELYSLGNVLISGSNDFNDNFSEGLAVDAQGSVTISGTQILNNHKTGASLISSQDIVLDCSNIIGNNGYGVDADTPSLVFNGVEITQNTKGDAINNGWIFFNSNSCFNYTTGKRGGGIGVPSAPALPVNKLTVTSGQLADIKCEDISGTLVSLVSGDGVYVPCKLGDTVRLIDMEQDGIPDFLPRGYKFVSSFNLTVMQENQPLAPLGESKSIWFWNTGTSDAGKDISQFLYWDGKDWVEVGDKAIPFLRVFFNIPESERNSNFTILFWDNSKWVELTDNLNLGSGRFVDQGGHSSGVYFEASVNFTGTFVLVKK